MNHRTSIMPFSNLYYLLSIHLVIMYSLTLDSLVAQDSAMVVKSTPDDDPFGDVDMRPPPKPGPLKFPTDSTETDSKEICTTRITKKVLMGSTEEIHKDMLLEECEQLCATVDYCGSALFYVKQNECWINSQSKEDTPDLFVDEWWDEILYLGNCEMPTTTPKPGASTAKPDRLSILQAKYGNMMSPDDAVRRCRDHMTENKCDRMKIMNLCKVEFIKYRCMYSCEECRLNRAVQRQMAVRNVG